MQILEFFLSADPTVNRLAFLGLLVFLMRQKRRPFRRTLAVVVSTYIMACHLSAFLSELTGIGAGSLAFVVGMAGGMSVEEVLKLVKDKANNGTTNGIFSGTDATDPDPVSE